MLILNKSVPNKGKSKNGDHSKLYEDDEILIGCVADGVGGCPCDYKASEQVCEDIIYYYLNEFRPLGVKEGIANSLRKTFARLYWTKGECEGMLSTLVCLVIDKARNDYFSISVGDSKILEIWESSVVELSRETEFRVQPDLLFPFVFEHGKLSNQLGFALMSDGFWANRKSHESELAYLLSTNKTEEYFEQILSLYQKTQFDDMTLMVIKPNLQSKLND
jgi:serine/threonine protein phosphatase PrpC